MAASAHRRWGWGWAGGAGWSIILGTLIFLSAQTPRDLRPAAVAAPTPHPDWAADFPARIARVTTALAQLPWPLPTPVEEPQGAGAVRWTRRLYTLTVPVQAADAVAQRFEPVRRAARDVTVDVTQTATGAQVRIGVEGLLTHTLTLHWMTHHPHAAIIIDALGTDLQIAHTLASLNLPLTFAVTPFRPFSKEVAELATIFHREVLLHLPVDAQGGGTVGAAAVPRAGADRTEILRRLDAALAAVPHAAGADTDLGARSADDRRRMQWVLERLKQKGLFLVDGRTAPQSVACAAAAGLAVPCAAPDVFLDDADDPTAIAARIGALIKLALARGDAIAIGHARPDTARALEAAVPVFAVAGVDVVPASTVVAEQTRATGALSRR